MSSNLFWSPVPKAKRDLSDSLKFALRKRYGESVDVLMTDDIIPYLEGLRDAGVHDADKLIAAIRKHGEVHVREEY